MLLIISWNFFIFTHSECQVLSCNFSNWIVFAVLWDISEQPFLSRYAYNSCNPNWDCESAKVSMSWLYLFIIMQFVDYKNKQNSGNMRISCQYSELQCSKILQLLLFWRKWPWIFTICDLILPDNTIHASNHVHLLFHHHICVNISGIDISISETIAQTCFFCCL